MFLAQSIWLFLGSVFAWFTVYTDFVRFYNLYGSVTRIKDCVIPNPVTTPCFYGAFAFLVAFIWSVYIYLVSRPKKISIQKKLTILLIGSTIFAFSNLALEIYKFYFSQTTSKVSCSGVPAESIFTTPCFIGSMFFLGALILAFAIGHPKNSGQKIANK